MHSCRGTRSAAASLTFLLIASTLNIIAVAVAASIEYIRVYSAIAVFARVNIVYK